MKREVHRIDERTGPRGGKYWSLLLECGHREFREIPRLGPAAAAAGVSRRRRTSAPERVKCRRCTAAQEEPEKLPEDA